MAGILICDQIQNSSNTGQLTFDNSGNFTTGNLICTGTITGGTGLLNIGSGQIYKDTSGNVGIGTTSPTGFTGYTTLTLNNATNGSIVTLQKNGVEQGRMQVYANVLAFNSTTSSGSIIFNNGNVGEISRFDASGNLGLGVTPSAWNSAFRSIEVGNVGNSILGTGGSDIAVVSGAYFNAGWKFAATNSLGASNYEQYNGSHLWFIKAPAAHSAGDAISFTQAMTLTASGQLGVGTTSPTDFGSSYKVVEVSGSLGGYSLQSSGSVVTEMAADSGAAVGYTGTRSNHPHVFVTNNTERARIDTSGNLLVGLTSNSGVRCYVKGEGSTNGTWSIYATNSSGTTQFGLRNDNYLYAPSVGGYGTTGTTVVVNGNYLGYLSSSIRFKKDIVDYDKGLTEILTLRPVYYKSKNPNPDGQYDEQRYAGLIAEEIADLGFDEFVLNGPDGKINSIQYGNMVSICIKSIQEQQELIEKLTARITALESK